MYVTPDLFTALSGIEENVSKYFLPISGSLTGAFVFAGDHAAADKFEAPIRSIPQKAWDDATYFAITDPIENPWDQATRLRAVENAGAKINNMLAACGSSYKIKV